MRKKDIKKIFYTCAKSSEININSEEIKSAVMEKIGMSNKEKFYTTHEEEEAVEPTFVTAPKKSKSITAIKIAAVGAAAAACFGVTALCMGMFGEGGILSALPHSNAENNKNVPTETATVTDVPGGQNVNSEIPGEDNGMQFVFLDGVCFMYNPSDKNPYQFSGTDMEKTIPFLYEKNGRLYIVMTKDGEERTEDITDKITSDDFYLYTYNNPADSVNPTHYVIIGGDVSAGDYGYMEIFKIKNNVNYWGWEGNFSKISPDLHSLNDLDNSGKKWIANGIRELTENYDVAADMIGNGIGSCSDNVDFKYRDDFKYGHEIMQFTLLDGCQYNLNYYNPGVCFDESDVTPLLYEENGRVYFIANEDGKDIYEDITDKINPDDFYLHIYNNPNNPVNQTHYVIVCGDMSEGNYGYWEVFQIYNDKDPLQNQWCWVGQQSKSNYSEMQWYINAQNMLKNEYGVNTVSVGSCKTNADFKAARN